MATRYPLLSWSRTPQGRVISPIALAIFGYALFSVRIGSPAPTWFVGVALIIGVLASELTRLVPEYAEMQADALCVRKLRGRYQPQRKYVAYQDVNSISERSDGSFDIAYAGFAFWTRQPAERHELVRVNDPAAFLEDLQTRIEERTGGRVAVT